MVNVKTYLAIKMKNTLDLIIEVIRTDLLKNNWSLIGKPVEIQSDFMDFMYKFSFENGSDIKLTFFFDELANTHNIGVFIENNRIKDDIKLSDWLKYNGNIYKKDPFEFQTYHPNNIKKQIYGIITFLKETFDLEEVKKIISGENWDETPFDWGGLR